MKRDKYFEAQERLRQDHRKMDNVINDDNLRVIDTNSEMQKHYTFGQKAADRVAKIGGSWGFVFGFIIFLAFWMSLNVLEVFGAHFDPYPFILLNLFLSCIAAIQAPVIMMSQNRSEERDRLERENAYHVNLMQERELRILHSKIDALHDKIDVNHGLLVYIASESKKGRD